MFSNYFHPVSKKTISFKEQLNQNTLGFHVNCYDESFPQIENTDIALIIVPESRGGGGEENDYFSFRRAFYSLFRGNWDFRITDFGDLKSGSSLKDTYFALNDIVSSLLSQSIFPLVIGGTHDLIYPIYQSYESFSKGLNLLCVDSRFDLLDMDMDNINSRNFLGHIVKKEPNHLHHFTNLGFQSYLCQYDESHLLEKMFFDSLRLGDLRENIKETEPYLRNSDIVSIDLSSIKQGDSPGSNFSSPNGIASHHSCVIARYTGMSDRVSCFSIFEYNSSKDLNQQTVNLIAQIVWYFLEGFSLRKGDYPNAKTINKNYKKYFIPIRESDLQFIFYKSNITGRWWVSSCMELDDDSDYKESIIPCSYEDYLSAISGDIPKRIYRILQRIDS